MGTSGLGQALTGPGGRQQAGQQAQESECRHDGAAGGGWDGGALIPGALAIGTPPTQGLAPPVRSRGSCPRPPEPTAPGACLGPPTAHPVPRPPLCTVDDPSDVGEADTQPCHSQWGLHSAFQPECWAFHHCPPGLGLSPAGFCMCVCFTAFYFF